MSAAIRLVAFNTGDPQTIRFCAAFPAPRDAEGPRPAEAWLETGEDPALSLGPVYAPSDATWRDQRLLDLATYTYHDIRPFTARLLWGEALAEVVAVPGVGGPAETAPAAAQLSAFGVECIEGRLLERTIHWEVSGLADGCILRVDSGDGQAVLLPGEKVERQPGEWRVIYAKPGTYLAAMDVMDADGFWLATLAEYPVEVVNPEEVASSGPAPLLSQSQPYAPAADRPSPDSDMVAQPWLLTRYARPSWGWLRAYGSQAARVVVRVPQQGAYLSIRAEASIGDSLWYQTAGGDWVCARDLELARPSDLRGVELGVPGEPMIAKQPSGAPEEPVPLGRAGVVTAAVLNVRPRPGVRADNQPSEQLQSGTAVAVYEEVLYGGVRWCRIGPDRWVYGEHLRLLPPSIPPQLPGQPPVLPVGWVVAPSLNVRPRPGVEPDNEPVGRVEHNQALRILDTCLLGSTPWYCIGEERWVEGAWVAPARRLAKPAGIEAGDRWVAVSLGDQTLVAYEGERPVYAALVATGAAVTPTPGGLFHVQRRAERDTIAGGSPARGSSYYLEDVPWLTYFHGGYALHGAYWHDSFGRPRSHGCVNLSLYDAWWLYLWQVDSVLIY